MQTKIILFFSLLLLSAFISMSFSNGNESENQDYTIVKKFEAFEIRQYNPVLMASVVKKGQMMDIGNAGFKDLAGFIFGQNAKSQKIAMTAPVTYKPSNGNADSTEMSFTMPKEFSLSNIPQPLEQQVKIHTSKACTKAILTFGGFASNQKLEEMANQFRVHLKKEGIEWKEPYHFLAYDPPFKITNRRNEVAFEL